jgi:hypothetical protein
VNGTWSSKQPPNMAQTVLGALVIALVILIGLLYQSDRGQLINIRITSAAQASPSPSPSPSRR